MGLLATKFSFNQKARVLILGLDAAGKTKILYQLKLHENVTTIPTIGFNTEELETPIKNVTFSMWDVGAQEKMRAMWKNYYKGSDGLLFVVDAADPTRIQEARRELLSILNAEEMDKGVPTVILANKQDQVNALKANQMTERMGLKDLQTNPWHVQEICALNGEGLYEALDTMATMVKRYQKHQKKRKSI